MRMCVCGTPPYGQKNETLPACNQPLGSNAPVVVPVCLAPFAILPFPAFLLFYLFLLCYPVRLFAHRTNSLLLSLHRGHPYINLPSPSRPSPPLSDALLIPPPLSLSLSPSPLLSRPPDPSQYIQPTHNRLRFPMLRYLFLPLSIFGRRH
ncbi:hypothetical protein LY76DRAFT_381406 [Colletotrichum caudatum]|nr:hypothetical protein LY76DRAFT_381406 [Colletotrichum caudatum]